MGESYSIVYVCTASSLPIHFFSSVQLLRRVWLFSTPWTAACQASLSITNAQSLLKLTSIESVMPSDHLILCHPLLLLPSIFLSFRVFSNESALCNRWSKCWSFSFSISPSSEYSGLISFRSDWFDLLAGIYFLRLGGSKSKVKMQAGLFFLPSLSFSWRWQSSLCVLTWSFLCVGAHVSLNFLVF